MVDEEFEELKKKVKRMHKLFSTPIKRENSKLFINGKHYELGC